MTSKKGQEARFNPTSRPFYFMEPATGFEPATYALRKLRMIIIIRFPVLYEEFQCKISVNRLFCLLWQI